MKNAVFTLIFCVFCSGCGNQPEAPPAPLGALPPDTPDLGRRVYVRCQACHGVDGMGIPGNFPPLKGSTVLTAADPTAAIRSVLRGMPQDKLNGAMPAFTDLADYEIAAVLSWTRSQWGNNAPAVDPAAVTRERR